MTDRLAGPMTCAEADALAGARAFAALDAADEASIAAHLRTCPEPHPELRAAPGAGAVLGAALEPVPPPPALRARILATIGGGEATPLPARPAWYRHPWAMRGMAGLAAAAVVALAAWNVQLRATLGEREATLQRVAAALTDGGPAHRVTGSAGAGLLIAGSDGPLLVADLPPPDGDHLYEMWLIDAAGTPVAVGTFRPDAADQLVIVELERPLAGFMTFAITIEAERVAAPTGEPVLVAPLG